MTTFKIAFATIAFGLSSPSLAQETDWRVTTLDEIGVSFVDLISLVKAGDQITFWYQLHLRDKKNLSRMIANVSANCTTKSFHDIKATGYRADGTSADITNRSTRSVSPGSNMAGLVERACTGSWLSKAAVNPPVFADDFFRTLK